MHCRMSEAQLNGSIVLSEAGYSVFSLSEGGDGADINGDGSVDIAIHSLGNIGVLFGAPLNSTWISKQIDSATPENKGGDLRLVDVNGDGFKDIVSADHGARLRVYLSSGSGTLFGEES